MAAFRHAARIGCDAVELDVHLTRDEALVVVHDAIVHLPNGSVADVRRLTLSDVRTVDAGEGQTIPTLAEVFEVLGPTELDVQIELKGEGVVDATAAEVRRAELADCVVFTSFHHARVLAMRRLIPAVRTGVLVSSVPVDIVEVARRAEADAVHLHHARLSRQVVVDVHEAGLRIVAWGIIKEDHEFDRLFGLGVDAIGSDWPSRLLARRDQVFDGQ